MIEFFLFLIIIAISLGFIRFLKGPTLTDRVVAFDTISIIAVSFLVIASVTFKQSFYLDVAFVFALIGFIGTIVFARFNLFSKDAND